MSESGLLAHLRDHFHVPPENLAYILNESESARYAFNRFLKLANRDLPEVRLFRTQYVSTDDSGIPDLVGYSEGANRPFLGEVKFDAGLTSHQPVSYIRTLKQNNVSSLLLFIVPKSRTEFVWVEMRRRCQAASVPLSIDSLGDSPLYSAASGNVTVALVSWNEVLNHLEDSLRGDFENRALWDLRQLRAMCERQESEAFEPLSAPDLDERIGRRIGEYIGLVFELATDVLVADGTVHIGGLRQGATRGYVGHFLQIAGWQCLLHVSWGRWARLRRTPVWLELNDWDAQQYAPLHDALRPLATEDPSRVLTVDGWKPLIPIYLQEGVARDELREYMANQIRHVARLLQATPKPKAESADQS